MIPLSGAGGHSRMGSRHPCQTECIALSFSTQRQAFSGARRSFQRAIAGNAAWKWWRFWQPRHIVFYNLQKAK
jgi:hypothetical protein